MPTKVEPMEIPYLSNNGKPFHKLTDGQRRWYTKGNLSIDEESELLVHASLIEERVRHYQQVRLTLRKHAAAELKFREDTGVEERTRRLKVVEGMKKEYKSSEEAIHKLKGTVFSVTPGALMLEPVI